MVLGWVVQQVQVFPLDLDVPTGSMRCLGPVHKMLRASSAASPGPPGEIRSDMARASPVPCWAGAVWAGQGGSAWQDCIP